MMRKKLTNKDFFYILSYGVLFFVFLVTLCGVVVNILPSRVWFEYESVEPLSDRFSVGEQVTFVSTNKIHRKVSFSWTDILRCDLDATKPGYVYYSTYRSDGQGAPHELRQSEWSYNGLVPREPATCFLESNIAVELPLNITKRQQVISGEFRIE